jgi:hypothetical protein
MQALTPPIVATSIVAQGVLTWAVPLIVFLVVLFWYLMLLRNRHPE